MAGISSDILTSLMRTNLNNLKSFAELVNAELTEHEFENESRTTNQANISQILKKFAEAEAFFIKGDNCLQKVDKLVKKKNLTNDLGELVTENSVLEEINSTIKSITGKENVRDNSEESVADQFEANGLRQHLLDDIKDILNEIHPMQLEDDENVDSVEENQMIKQLEAMQKRALAKTMKRVTDHDVEPEENAESIDDSDEEEIIIPAHNFERAENRKMVSKNGMDVDKFENLYTDFKGKIIRGSDVNAKQLFESKIQTEADIKHTKLPLYSKYHEKVLELFSKEAIVVMEQKQSFTDPISKTAIQNPVRNKKCEHIYERDTVYNMLKNKKSMRCPYLGCSCSFTTNDLEEDEETAAKISQNLSQARQSHDSINEDEETDSENAITDDEVRSDDDTQSQEIL